MLQIVCIFLSVFTFAQSYNIAGKVSDSSSQALGNVSIKVLGSSHGTTTNDLGEFKIAVAKGQTLVFSYLGFAEKRVVITDDEPININLSTTSQNSLNEVVVVGYGTKRKLNLTGAVSSVNAKELENRPVSNISSALQGTMAGVTVTSTGGQPGNDYGNIFVQGMGTLGNTNPMVVVDGVVSTINDVNSNDIESVTVLKDAASGAIYGSRASNGVILITTKKGKIGGTVVHYTGYVGKQSATRLPDYLPSWQAGSFYNEALVNEGKAPRYAPGEIQKLKDGSDPDHYANTDWLGLFYNGSGFQQSHFIDVSGGNEKTQSYLSLGYFSQDGIIQNSGFQRYTGRFKITSKLGSHLSVNGNLAYTFEDTKQPTNPYTGQAGTTFWEVNRISPTVPYKYSNGYYGYFDDGNPIAWQDLGATRDNNGYFLRSSVDADLLIVKGLHFKPLLGYQLTMNQSKNFVKDIQYYDWQTGNPTYYEGPNSLTDYNDNTTVVTLQALLQYDKSFGFSNFSAMAGYSQEYTHFNFLRGYRKSFLNNSLAELNAGPVTGQQATGSAYEIALQSWFGRISYDYKNKYLLEGNIRYDGSSRFAAENRWGVYPSFSGGWRISEENFFESLKNTISDLKIRGSWGKLGNQNLSTITNSSGTPVGNYPYIPTISSGQNYDFGGAVAPGLAPLNGANPLITWESTYSTDFGLDVSILKGKISFSADYFIRNTDNILLNIPVSSMYGFNAPVQNGGTVRNTGFEMELGYHGSGKNFTYNISANASFIKNTVTDLKGIDPIINDFSFLKVGLPINSFYGYQAEGIFQTQDQVNKHATQSGGVIAPGDLMYKDQNGDGVINGADRVYLGSYFPKTTYGLNLSGTWKGFDMTIFLQGAAGIEGLIRGVTMGMIGDKDGKPTTIFENHWTPATPTNNFPRLWTSYTQNDPATNNSSFWVRDAGYMRLKNLQIGYTLPIKLTSKAGIQKLRIYYSGQNILTFSQFYKWVDPEAPAGESGYTYPQVKVNTIGINITF